MEKISYPAHINSAVVEDAIAAVRLIATEGVGEKEAAHGISVVVCNAKKVMSMKNGEPEYGEVSKEMFDFSGQNKKKRLSDVLGGNGAAKGEFQAMCKEDGSIIVDGVTGEIWGANFLIGNILCGAKGRGARHRANSAVSQQADGCVALKASEDVCGHSGRPPPSGATIDLFFAAKEPLRQIRVGTPEEWKMRLKKRFSLHQFGDIPSEDDEDSKRRWRIYENLP